MEEIWKDIPGFEYQISNFGRVKSLDRVIPKNTSWGGIANHHKKGKILKFWSKHHNYQCIYLCKDGTRNVRMVHRLVAQAFLGLDLKDTKIEVGHMDNDPSNNNVDNLYLTNHRENEDHKMLCGRTTLGEKNGRCKLTEKQVVEIYKKYKSGVRVVDLQKEYLHGGIYDIIRGVTWKHLYHHF